MQIFPDVNKAEWLAKVEKDLRGKPLAGLDFEVVGKTFSPIHHQDDTPTAYHSILRTSPEVGIGVVIDAQDPVAANKKALKALNHGASELLFTINVDQFDEENLRDESSDVWAKYKEQLISGIHLSMAQVHIYTESDHGDNLRTEGSKMHHADGRYMKAIASFPGLLFRACRTYAHFREMAVHDTPFAVSFWLTTTDDYLTNLAYFRACRLCWLQMATILPGLAPACRLLAHVRTPFRRDPETAKISATAHAASAISGGADAVFIDPFSSTSTDEAKGEFERRIGLNIQHILELESSMGRVQDPAAGSYFIERITDHIASHLWEGIQQQFANVSERSRLYTLLKELPDLDNPLTKNQ